MSERVRVDSVDALMKFRAALCQVAEKIRIGLDEAEADIQRTIFWVKHEQSSYWKNQGEKRAELVIKAKNALNRKKLQRTDLGSKFSYIEEEKELLKAQRRLEEAKQKLVAVQRWGRRLDEESFSYKAVSQGMSQTVDVDVPNALAQLDNMIAALEAYASSGTPSEQSSTAELTGAFAGAAGAGSMRRSTPEDGGMDAGMLVKLRERTPPASVRSTIPVTTPSFGKSATDARIAAATETVKQLGLPTISATPGEYVVAARGAWEYARVYLERVEKAGEGDSGWYVGYADDTVIEGYEAAPLSEIRERRKEWAGVLQLPEGALVVFNKGVLTAALGPDNALLWPSE